MKLFFLFMVVLFILQFTPPIRRNRALNSSFSIEWTTFLKAVCALLIVIHHISKMPHQWYGETLSFGLALFSQFVYWSQTVVGIFFFISGYGLVYSVCNKSDYLQNFARKRLLRIVVPWVIITVLNIVVNQLFSDGFSLSGYCADFWNKGRSEVFGWFIPTLILFYIAFWLSFKYCKSHFQASVVVAVLTLGIMAFCITQGYGGYWYLSDFCFPLGMFYYLFEKKMFSSYRMFTLIVLSFLVILSFLGALGHGKSFHIVPEMTCLLIAMLSYVYMPLRNHVIKFLSKISYELFLVHGFFLFAADHLHTQVELPFAIWACGILVLSILTAYIYHVLSNKLLRPFCG